MFKIIVLLTSLLLISTNSFAGECWIQPVYVYLETDVLFTEKISNSNLVISDVSADECYRAAIDMALSSDVKPTGVLLGSKWKLRKRGLMNDQEGIVSEISDVNNFSEGDATNRKTVTN